jgi:hypothetical protein
MEVYLPLFVWNLRPSLRKSYILKLGFRLFTYLWAFTLKDTQRYPVEARLNEIWANYSGLGGSRSELVLL